MKAARHAGIATISIVWLLLAAACADAPGSGPPVHGTSTADRDGPTPVGPPDPPPPGSPPGYSTAFPPAVF